MLRLAHLYLPSLFPSWRFFEEIGPSPRIEFRRASDSAWSELAPPPAPRRPLDFLARLFHSPAWNEHLYLVSTAIRQSVEPTPLTQATLSRLVASRIGGTEPFTFRIVYLAREGDQIGKFLEYESGLLAPKPS